MEYLDKTSCLQAAMMMLEGGFSSAELIEDGWDVSNVSRAVNVIERHPSAGSSDEIPWDTCRYLPGCGPYHVGWRVRFDGIEVGSNLWPGYEQREHPEYLDPQYEGRYPWAGRHYKGAWGVRYHTDQRVVMPGELATVVTDNGWSSRYTYELELDGLKVRPGPGNWNVVGNKDRPPHPTTEKYIDHLLPTRS